MIHCVVEWTDCDWCMIESHYMVSEVCSHGEPMPAASLHLQFPHSRRVAPLEEALRAVLPCIRPIRQRTREASTAVLYWWGCQRYPHVYEHHRRWVQAVQGQQVRWILPGPMDSEGRRIGRTLYHQSLQPRVVMWLRRPQGWDDPRQNRCQDPGPNSIGIPRNGGRPDAGVGEDPSKAEGSDPWAPTRLEWVHKVDRSLDSVQKRTFTLRGKSQQPQRKVLSNPQHTVAKCTRCGRDPHPRHKCPTKDSKCHKCHKRGHFSALCFSKAVGEIHDPPEMDDFAFLNGVGSV